MRRQLTRTAAVAVIALAGALAGVPATDVVERGSAVLDDRVLVKKIKRQQRATWRWQRLMGVRRTPNLGRYLRTRDPEYRRFVLYQWRRRALRAKRRAMNPPHEYAWRCLQRHEGAWNDPHAPYYGGLQMDISFQRAYGSELLRRKGTADKWTPLEQMWVAERAYRSGRGFYPWPNTARACGLI